MIATAELEPWYSPHRLLGLFSHFEELQTLAESPMTARGLIGPEREGPTPTDPKVQRMKGGHGDGLRWADVVADLEMGLDGLTSGGVGVKCLYAIKDEGVTVYEFVCRNGLDYQHVQGHCEMALDKISRRLTGPAASSYVA